MANNYALPAKAIIFRTPTYIHSHASKLSDINAAYDNNVLTRIKLDTSNKISEMSSYLGQYSSNPDIQNFYNETHESNGLRKTRGPEKRILDKMTEYRTQLALINKGQRKSFKAETELFTKFLMESMQASGGVQTIAELIGEEFAKYLVEFLKAEAESKGYVKKYKDLDPNDTINRLLQTSNGKLTKVFEKNIEKYYRTHRNLMSENIVASFNEFQKELDNYIATMQETSRAVMNSDDLQNLQKRIEKLMSHKLALTAITASGFQFEKLYNFLLEGALLRDSSLSVNGTKIMDGLSQSTTGHELTTDNVIKIFNEKTNKISEIGVTLKNSFDSTHKKLGTNFSKTTSITLENLFDSLPLGTTQSLMYFLYNRVALSVFAAPKKYSQVIKNINSTDYNIPHSEKVPLMDKSVIELYESYVGLCFVKAFIGELFFKKDFDILIDNTASYVPPVWIGFGEYDYWTYKILEEVNKEFLNNFNGFKEYTTMANPNSAIMEGLKPLYKYFTEKKLTDLFVLKKMIESTNANRYQDLLNNNISSVYSQIAPNSNVNDLLTVLTQGLQNDVLKWATFGSVGFSIPIKNFIR